MFIRRRIKLKIKELEETEKELAGLPTKGLAELRLYYQREIEFLKSIL
jgi:hypothetical protein